MKVSDLLWMPTGKRIPRELFNRLVIESKASSKKYFEGEDWYLGNTPQRGIHWIKAKEDHFKAAIVKIIGNGYTDRFLTADPEVLYYHLKAQNGRINRKESANVALIEQPNYGYPVLVLDGSSTDDWIYLGRYEVINDHGEAITLRRMHG